MSTTTTIHALSGPGGQQLPAMFTGDGQVAAALAWASELYQMREVLSARGAEWRKRQAARRWQVLRFGDEGERAAAMASRTEGAGQ